MLQYFLSSLDFQFNLVMLSVEFRNECVPYNITKHSIVDPILFQNSSLIGLNYIFQCFQ